MLFRIFLQHQNSYSFSLSCFNNDSIFCVSLSVFCPKSFLYKKKCHNNFSWYKKSLYAKPVWFCHTETQNFLHAVPLCFMNDLYRHACTHPALSCLFPLTAGDPSKPTQYHLLIHNTSDSFSRQLQGEFTTSLWLPRTFRQLSDFHSAVTIPFHCISFSVLHNNIPFSSSARCDFINFIDLF